MKAAFTLHGPWAELLTARSRTRDTLASLGRRSGLHPNHISTLETGHGNPSPRTILRLADALGVEPADLYPSNSTPNAAAKRWIPVLRGQQPTGGAA